MKFVALVSGGKDSNYNILHCLKHGHELAAFANLHPENEAEQELDSFMFQTVGHDLVSWYPKCCGIPLYRQAIRRNGSKNVALNYSRTEDDEIEDLYKLLQRVQENIPDIEAVSVGAILSSYQRSRVEDVCSRLGLVCLSYLWQRNQAELMREMCLMSKDVTSTFVDTEEVGKLDARIIKVAAIGLNQEDLGKSLPQIQPKMIKLNTMYDVHICGEGGEFETTVLDAPFFANGHLRLSSLVNTTGTSNDGVFNVKMNVEYIESKLPPSHLEQQLNLLPVPSLLNDKWWELHQNLLSSVASIPEIESENADLKIVTAATVPVSINEVGKQLFISNIRPSKGESLREKCLDVFAQLESILLPRKIFPSQILYSSLLLADMSIFQEVNHYYNDFFEVSRIGPLPPARACIETQLLNCPLQLSVVVDLSSNCYPLDNGIVLNDSKDGLHVQGRSYWCPCNIGPYSQAVWNKSDRNKVSYISGQIGLQPSTMEMCYQIGESTSVGVNQAALSLRHYFTLSGTIDSEIPLSVVCYISEPYMLSIVTKAWSLLAEELPDTSENWYDDEYVEKSCLIVVLVSNLPKGALCEWSGVNCHTRAIEDDYDEDDLAAQIHKNLTIKNQTTLSLPTSTDVHVSENNVKRHFITLFLDSVAELTTTLSESNAAQITLFYNPAQSVPEYTNVEYVPVTKIYDHESSARLYGLILRY